MRTISLLAAVVAAALLAAPASARTWKQDWTVGAHPGLQVTTNDARVHVLRGDTGKMSATIEYTVEVWGFHTRVQEPLIEFTRTGDTIAIVARTHSSAVFFGGMVEKFHVDVTVPPTCDVRVRSGDGGVDVQDIAGNIDLQTSDGHLAAHGARGRIRLWTGDGGIDADSLDGALEAHSGDGHLKVAGRFDALDLHTGDGRVHARIERGSTLASPWSVRTGDGGVMLLIPRDLRALLDVSSGDGHVRVDLPIANVDGRSHRELRGQLNGGTVPLRVRTGDGSITLGLSE
jgi:hypothetical protein